MNKKKKMLSALLVTLFLGFLCFFISWKGIDETGVIEKAGTKENGQAAEENLNKDAETEQDMQQHKLAGQELANLRESEAEGFLSTMTLQDKIAQLFLITPEALSEEPYAVGGFVYFDSHLHSQEQVKKMLSDAQEEAQRKNGLPLFLAVDEEGGTVARVAESQIMEVPLFPDMAELGKENDADKAKEAGAAIGNYLKSLGFNLDFAPVADVWTNPRNTMVEKRSFGSDPALVSRMALSQLQGLEEQGVYGCYKHFPGHGSTEGDTHDGYAYTEKSIEELKAADLIPFQDGIKQEISFIMTGHISVPDYAGNEPASLSESLVTGLLREEMGYQGIVITDALNMGAVVQEYSPEDAAVQAVKAGNDMLLMPEDFYRAYNGLLRAVEEGRIPEERIDESVKRILLIKLEMRFGC